jgi:hypothetical protein
VIFVYAYRAKAEHSTIIEDLLGFAADGKQEAVDACIIMLQDLYQQGLQSRFVKKLSNLRLWELKTRSRGGHKGGARVYFYVTPFNEVLVINAEVKHSDTPSSSKLKEALEIMLSYEREQHEKK